MLGVVVGILTMLRGVGGGFLLKAWHAAPFVLAAFVTTAACAAPILFIDNFGVAKGADVNFFVRL